MRAGIEKLRETADLMQEITWTKELSTTDAQQPTSGGLVPYLRLTKGDLEGEDFQSWFRNAFFAGANWSPGSFGRETDIEEAKVVVSVVINGVKLGDKPFTVTHGANRWEKHNTPNTWLHWPPAVQELLIENDLTGCPITLTRQPDGKFRMDIQAANS